MLGDSTFALADLNNAVAQDVDQQALSSLIALFIEDGVLVACGVDEYMLNPKLVAT